MFAALIGNLNNWLYTYILIVLLIGVGLYFTFKTKFVQFRMFRESLRVVTEPKEDKESISSFEALMVSTLPVLALATLRAFRRPFALAVRVRYSGCGLLRWWEALRLLSKARWPRYIKCGIQMAVPSAARPTIFRRRSKAVGSVYCLL